MEWNESNEREFSGMQFPRHDNTIRTWPDLMRAKAASNWIHGTSFHSISWTMEYGPAMTRTTTTRTATSSSSSTLLLGRMSISDKYRRSESESKCVGGWLLCYSHSFFRVGILKQYHGLSTNEPSPPDLYQKSWKPVIRYSYKYSLYAWAFPLCFPLDPQRRMSIIKDCR